MTQPLTLKQTRHASDRAALVAALNATRHTGGTLNLSAAARALGISRMSLYRLVEKTGLDLDRLSSEPAPTIAAASRAVIAEQVPAGRAPAVGETWYVQIGRAPQVETVIVEALTACTVLLSTANPVSPYSIRAHAIKSERYSREAVRFLEPATPAESAASAPAEPAPDLSRINLDAYVHHGVTRDEAPAFPNV